jgi:uncharacterized membrane protein
MKLRFSKLKLLLLVAMSVFGLWASSTVLVIFYTLNESLPLCPTGSYPVDFFGLHYVFNLDCGAVLSSPYSVVFGVPLELLALFYFAVNLGLVYLIAFGSESTYSRAMRVLFGWRFIGIIIVPYLVFIELFKLHAICIYCTVMHVAIVTDFIVISYLLFFRRGGKEAEMPASDPALTP